MPGSVRLCNAVVFFSFGCVIATSGIARAAESRDVVVDNRGASSQPGRDYEMDSPFAESKPDPVQNRKRDWRPGWGASFGGGWAIPSGTIGERVKGESFLFADV